MSPVTDCRQLRPGDVLLAELRGTRQDTGEAYVWKSYRIVHSPLGRGPSRSAVDVVLSKLNPEPKDYRTLNITDKEVVRVLKLDETEYPQGVIAVRMKMIMRGDLTLEY